MKFVLWINDAETEPYEIDTLREAVENQTLPTTTPARLENETEWEPLWAQLRKAEQMEESVKRKSGLEFYVWKDGQQVGPLSKDEVNLQVNEGILKQDCLVWAVGLEGEGLQGLTDWMPYDNPISVMSFHASEQCDLFLSPFVPTCLCSEPSLGRLSLPIDTF